MSIRVTDPAPIKIQASPFAVSASANVTTSTIGPQGPDTAAAHALLTTGTHGVGAGAIVGTTLTQTLTNKTLTSPTLNTPTLTAPVATGSLASFGGAWSTYTPTIAGVTVTSLVGRYTQVGKTVTATVSFALSAAPTGQVQVGVPVTASISQGTGSTTPKGVASGLRTGVAYRTGVVVLSNLSVVSIVSDNTAAPWSNTVPVSWVSGDLWGLTFTYEAA